MKKSNAILLFVAPLFLCLIAIWYGCNHEKINRAVRLRYFWIRYNLTEDKELRQEIAIKFMNEKAIEYLCKMLRRDDFQSKIEALRILCDIGDKESSKEIIPLLDDKNERIRLWAIKALTVLKEKRTIEKTIQLLSDPCNDVRIMAASYFGQIKAKEAVPHLLMVLKGFEPWGNWKNVKTFNDNIQFAKASAAALGNIGDESVIPFLISLLKNDIESPGNYDKISVAIAGLENFTCDQSLSALEQKREDIQEHLNALKEASHREEDNKTSVFFCEQLIYELDKAINLILTKKINREKLRSVNVL